MNPFKDLIPEHRMDDWREDYRSALISSLQIPDDELESSIDLDYSIILIRARKDVEG